MTHSAHRHSVTTSSAVLWYDYQGYGPDGCAVTFLPDSVAGGWKQQYFYTDNVGSIRRIYERWHSGVTDTIAYTYSAFGERSGDSLLSRVGYIGKEHDYESGYINLGIRLYEPGRGLFVAPDPHWHKYINLSPYNYAGNTPLIAIDATGFDILVLLAPKGANGMGHMAVLIGNDREGWNYVSKDGALGNNPVWGPAKDFQKDYGNFGEFLQYNQSREQPYTSIFQIESNDDEDNEAHARAVSKSREDYNLFTNNCMHTVGAAVSTLSDVSGYFLRRPFLHPNMGFAFFADRMWTSPPKGRKMGSRKRRGNIRKFLSILGNGFSQEDLEGWYTFDDFIEAQREYGDYYGIPEPENTGGGHSIK